MAYRCTCICIILPMICQTCVAYTCTCIMVPMIGGCLHCISMCGTFSLNDEEHVNMCDTYNRIVRERGRLSMWHVHCTCTIPIAPGGRRRGRFGSTPQ